MVPQTATRKQYRKMVCKGVPGGKPAKPPVVAAPAPRPATALAPVPTPVEAREDATAFLLDAPEVDCLNCGASVIPQSDARRVYFYCQRCGADWREEHGR